jgi:hypothetical protein
MGDIRVHERFARFRKVAKLQVEIFRCALGIQ